MTRCHPSCRRVVRLGFVLAGLDPISCWIEVTWSFSFPLHVTADCAWHPLAVGSTIAQPGNLHCLSVRHLPDFLAKSKNWLAFWAGELAHAVLRSYRGNLQMYLQNQDWKVPTFCHPFPACRVHGENHSLLHKAQQYTLHTHYISLCGMACIERVWKYQYKSLV